MLYLVVLAVVVVGAVVDLVDLPAGQAVGFRGVVVVVVAGHGLGGRRVGVGVIVVGEAVAEVGEAEEAAEVVGGEVGVVGAELSCGAGGGVGDLEVGLEAEGFADGGERAAEAGSAEPLAHDGGRGPIGRRRAGGGGAEGA